MEGVSAVMEKSCLLLISAMHKQIGGRKYRYFQGIGVKKARIS